MISDVPSASTRVTIAVVVLGLGFRLAGIHHGLPDFIEEAAPFRFALDMWSGPDGRVDSNPGNFIYPSLVLYLHLGLQLLHLTVGTWLGAFHHAADYRLSLALDPTPMVILARLLAVAADGWTIATTARIGERMGRGAGWAAALVLACSPIMIRTGRSIFTDPVMIALAVSALERMQRYGADPGLGRRLWIAALIGLAAGAKYPALILLLPFAWTLAAAHGLRLGAGLGLLALPAVALSFLATTPYAVLDAPAFLRDLRFDRVLAEQGLLGGSGGPSGWFTLRAVARDLGPVIAVLALGGCVLALRRRRTVPSGITVLLMGLGYLVPALASPLRFERYLLGVLPAVALLAGLAVAAIAARPSIRDRRWAVVALVAVLVVPAWAMAIPAAVTGIITTQMEARQWCIDHLGPDPLLVQDRYGAHLPSHGARDLDPGLVERASPELRRQFLERPTFASVVLPLSVAGSCIALLQDSAGRSVEVEVFPHASDFNRVVYDRRLLAGVDFVLTSQSVRGRFEAEPDRYAHECAFYRYLDSTAVEVARFEPRRTVSGPGIVLYRLRPDDADASPPDSGIGRWWWTERIPARFRSEANAILAPGSPSVDGPLAPDGGPAPWVLGLREVHRTRLAPFCRQLATELIALGRFAPGRALMESEHAIAPEDPAACYLLVLACRGLGDRAAALAAIERTAASRPGSRRARELLASEYAELLGEAGVPAHDSAAPDSAAHGVR